MPFLENLVEGFAGAANDPGTVNRIEQRKSDRKATADEELHANTQSILDDVQRLQDRRAALPAGSPEIAEIDKALAAHQKAFTDLYHPVRNPNNLQKLGGFLKQHIARRPPKPAPQSNAVTPERMAELRSSAAGTASPDPYLTPEELKKKARIAAGLEARAVPEKPESENWVPTLVKLADGREVTLQRNSKDGRWTDLAGNPVPKEVLSTASLVPKPAASGHSKFNEEAAVYENKWGKKIADWSPEQLAFFNKEMAYEAQHSGQSTTTKLVVDQDNHIVPVQVTSEHSPTARPIEDPSWTAGKQNAPKTPREAKQKAAAVAPKGVGSVKVGEPLPITAKNSVEQAAHKTYVTAYQLAQKADEVAKNPNDAVNQKRLAVALERIAAGRFTTQALDYIIKAGWGNSIEQWANSTTTGALPTDVMRQLIDGAHQERDSAYAAWQEARGGGGTTPAGTKEIHYKIVNGQLVAQ